MPQNKRPIRIEGDVAYVQLTQGYESIIDADKAEDIGKHNWYALVTGGLVYAVRKSPRPDSKTLLMHRELLLPREGYEVDHINGDGRDNRMSNLREATSQQNKHNQKAKGNNKSGYKGVFLEKRTNKWVAVIMCSGVNKWLGSYDNPQDAHSAYCKASKELHGEFGRAE
jgi:hypothetical protein